MPDDLIDWDNIGGLLRSTYGEKAESLASYYGTLALKDVRSSANKIKNILESGVQYIDYMNYFSWKDSTEKAYIDVVFPDLSSLKGELNYENYNLIKDSKELDLYKISKFYNIKIDSENFRVFKDCCEKFNISFHSTSTKDIRGIFKKYVKYKYLFKKYFAIFNSKTYKGYKDHPLKYIQDVKLFERNLNFNNFRKALLLFEGITNVDALRLTNSFGDKFIDFIIGVRRNEVDFKSLVIGESNYSDIDKIIKILPIDGFKDLRLRDFVLKNSKTDIKTLSSIIKNWENDDFNKDWNIADMKKYIQTKKNEAYKQKILKSYPELQEAFEGKIEQKINPVKIVTNDGWRFEILSKTDPLGLRLGELTNCCQTLEGQASSCVKAGYLNPYSSFLTIYKGDKLFGQAWVFVDENNECLILDNIEKAVKIDQDLLSKKLIEFCELSEYKNIQLGLGNSDFSYKDKFKSVEEEYKYRLKDYNGYTDSHNRVWLKESEDKTKVEIDNKGLTSRYFYGEGIANDSYLNIPMEPVNYQYRMDLPEINIRRLDEIDWNTE